MNTNERFRRCPVCGYYYDNFYPWGENGDSASFDICICCGAEWGYDDDTPEQKKLFRRKWLENGAKWHYPPLMPINWNYCEQLEYLRHEEDS